MARRNLEDRNVRKIFKSGKSYCITLPIEMMRKLNWREKQKVIFEMKGKSVVIKDWKK
jgi:antitoxin component of MazEF toxin-antitoxin module